MKCQHCEKPATVHITELTGPEVQEVHLCEEHARQYLKQEDDVASSAATLAGALVQQLKLGQTAEELARLDRKTCPVCGISFYEFRNQGRLGCPHDYICFEAELEPLIFNIHGASSHNGKRPKFTHGDSDWQTEMIRLRRELREAIEEERYEQASSVRDKIRSLERRSRQEKKASNG
jgi:protein arginine kinase activator